MLFLAYSRRCRGLALSGIYESSILGSLKMLMTLSTSEAKRREGTNTSSADVVSYLPRYYATDAVIANADEEICNSEQGWSTLWNSSQRL